MDPKTQEKLNHILALVAKLKAVEKEIEEALAPQAVLDPPEPKEPTKRAYTKKEKGPGRGRGARHCKNCGKAGHRSDSCPQGTKKKKGSKDGYKQIEDIEEKPEPKPEKKPKKNPEEIEEEPAPESDLKSTYKPTADMTLYNVRVMVENGIGDEDIAKKLHITENTVKTYRSRIKKEDAGEDRPQGNEQTLSAVDFAAVKEMTDENPSAHTPTKIANELGISLLLVDEIQRAQNYNTYAGYVQSKKPV